MSDLPIFQLKITLNNIRPPVWRRVLVSADATLDDLHDIIQAVMPWGDYHLHAFSSGGATYGLPDPDNWEPYDYDSSEVTLGEVLTSLKSKIAYTYDFGDGWQHEILLEKTLPQNPEIDYPLCTAGKRACPPDDCGGPWGYAEMLEAIKDPKHPSHEMYAEWLDEDFDPESFDLEEANEALSDLSSNESPMVPINRHLVILTPKSSAKQWMKKHLAVGAPGLSGAADSAFPFLVPFASSEEEMVKFMATALPEIITIHLLSSGVDRVAIADLDEDEMQDFYDLEMHPLVFDAGWKTPLRTQLPGDFDDFLGEEGGEE